MRKFIYICIILFVQQNAFAQCNSMQFWTGGYTAQMQGGEELMLRPRTDIGTNAYEVLLHVNRNRHNSQVNTMPFQSQLALDNAIYLTDSCFSNMQTVGVYSFNFTTNELVQNPFTLDSTRQRLHSFCTALPEPGPPLFNVYAYDSLYYMKDFWYSKIIYLPYPCGKWQICHNRLTLDTSTNIEYPCTPTPSIHFTFANDPKNINFSRLIQFSNLQANSMPGYASELDVVAKTYQWTSIPLNPIDAEGDSMRFTSVTNLTNRRAIPFRGLNYSAYGDILPYDTGVSGIAPWVGQTWVAVDTFDHRYKCLPGQSGWPNCDQYNPINNPFDCDSTYSVNPSTGEIRFYTETPNQHAYVTVKCEEYRSNTWLSTSYRVVRIHTIDSGYASNPILQVDTPNTQNVSISGDLEFYACAGSSIQIPLDIIEPQGLGALNVSDNHLNSIPTSSMAYTNNNTDSVGGLFSWNTLTTDSGWYFVVFTVLDSACAYSSFIHTTQRVMKIFISPNYIQNVQISSCNDTLLNGVLYTSSGSFTQSYLSRLGCDSIVNFDITINRVDTSISYGADHSLIAGASNASYQWIDCGTMLPIPGATSATYTATQWGTYACIITQNGCTDTTACLLLMVAPSAVKDYSIVSRLYPNPSKDSYQLSLDKNYRDVQLEIRTMSGQLVWEKNFSQLQETSIKLEEPSGVYILYIKQGERVFVKKILKY